MNEKVGKWRHIRVQSFRHIFDWETSKNAAEQKFNHILLGRANFLMFESPLLVLLVTRTQRFTWAVNPFSPSHLSNPPCPTLQSLLTLGLSLYNTGRAGSFVGCLLAEEARGRASCQESICLTGGVVGTVPSEIGRGAAMPAPKEKLQTSLEPDFPELLGSLCGLLWILWMSWGVAGSLGSGFCLSPGTHSGQ